MKFLRSVLFLTPAAGLLAQTPAPKPATTANPAPQITTLSAPPVSPSVPPDRVIISVGETKITAAQFNEIIDTLPENVRAQARGPRRKEFAENLVRIFLLAQEGRNLKLDQTPEYQTQTQFQSANLLAGKTFSQIAENEKIDDAAERAYYDQHTKDYEQVRARHILIRVKGSTVPLGQGKKELTDEEALAKAKEIRAKLDQGGDFAQLAKDESDDAGSRVNGGDLNFFKRGQMVGPFEEAAFSMKVGEISQPIKTQFGYHIIKVEARKTFEDVKPEIERRIRSEQAQNTLENMEKKAGVTLDAEFFGPPLAAPSSIPSPASRPTPPAANPK
jgi:peptidyl-prolyl cis-trans isomerase C